MRVLPWALFLLTAAGLPGAPAFRVALVGPAVAWADLTSPRATAPRPLLLAVTDGLTAFDPVTGFAVAGLASSWTVDESGKTWSFTLKAAKWSDGKALTSKDVAEAWKKAGVPAVISTPTTKVLKAVFSQPVTGPMDFALPPYLLTPDPVTGRGPGPFVLESQDAQGTLALKRNAAYRDAKSVRLTRLEFRFVPTLAEASRQFSDGRTDWVPRGGGPGTQVPPGLRHITAGPGAGLVFLRFNLNSPRLGDANYRRSLVGVLDRKAVAQGLRGPRLVPADSLVPGVPVPALAPVPKTLGADPEPVLTLLYPQGETYRTIALEVADQWKRRLGLSVTTQGLPYEKVKAARASGRYEVILSSWMADAPDPRAYLDLLLSGSPENDMGFADPVYDQLVGELRAATSKARSALVGRALVRVGEAVPLVPLLSYAWINQIDLRRWTGWTDNPTDSHPWTGIGPKK